MRSLRARLIICSKFLVTFLSTEVHTPLLFSGLGSDDNLVGVLPGVVAIQELEEPAVGVVVLLEDGLESQVGFLGLCSKRRLLGAQVVEAGFLDHVVEDLLIPGVDTVYPKEAGLSVKESR